MMYVKYWMEVQCNLSIKVEMDVLGNLRLVRDLYCGCMDGPSNPNYEYD